jgi:hypothetical protein
MSPLERQGTVTCSRLDQRGVTAEKRRLEEAKRSTRVGTIAGRTWQHVASKRCSIEDGAHRRSRAGVWPRLARAALRGEQRETGSGSGSGSDS